MKHFIAAIQFITVVPVGRPRVFEPAAMVPFFPLVGLLIGLTAAAFDRGVALIAAPAVVALLDVVLLIAVTGAFHLDGLGDTADGLYGRRPRQQALAIMKDSRIGVMGVTAIVCCLALKWAGIYGLTGHRVLALVVVPAYARASVLFGMRLLPYGRPEGGTGKAFFLAPLKLGAFWGLVPTLLLSAGLGWRTIWLNAAYVMIVATLLAFYKKKVNSITGDMLGAMIEISEAGLFLALSMGGIS
jgi:adenosylcobinamide-GDP ribazoletransferase